ncbi:MAG: enoyl-CoA hydratase/isomerase family protein, partial [Rhodobacteraceae bacterium]|nr:enoyl-CoA hydratase/isomerase family protein [Paracoccaceae bacterium]
GDCAAVQRLAAQSPRALVLTGAGPVFSAGGDLAELPTGLSQDPLWQQVTDRIAALPCLTIAALNGTVAGGAMGVALACDLRLAVPEATLFYPVLQRGVVPQPGDVARLHRLVGPARTKMIFLAGVRITAEVAQGWGLVDEILPPEGLLARAGELAAASMATGPTLPAAIKAMIDAISAPSPS